MPLALVDRDPTSQEMEAFRLVLSVQQDGAGQLPHPTNVGGTLPGWRDFERTVAFVFGGKAAGGKEGKNVFDVWLPDPSRQGINFGLSCKMRRTLGALQKTGHVTMELSNSAGKFWQQLGVLGLNSGNYKSQPQLVGETLVNLVKAWHAAESMANLGGTVDLAKSSYLSLSWSSAGAYQLHRFPLDLPNPTTLRWYCPLHPKTGKLSAHINGDDASGERLFEWYGESGGQLKYYPLVATALWASGVFHLEPLPIATAQYGLYLRATQYFPQLISLLPHPTP